jgi:hypothetical protein
MSADRICQRASCAVAVLLGLWAVCRTAPAADTGWLTSRPLPAVKEGKPLAVGAEVRTGAGQRRRVLLLDGPAVCVNEKTTLKLEGPRRLTLEAGEIFVEARSGEVVVKTPKREVTARATRFAVRAEEKGTGVVVASGRARVSGLDVPLTGGQQLPAGAAGPVPAPRVSHLLAWAQDLLPGPELVPPSGHAGGSLVARDPDGQEAKLALRKYHIDVHVEDGFARTTIDQTYFNHTTERLEGTFYFPLPPDASLSRLAMYIDRRANCFRIFFAVLSRRGYHPKGQARPEPRRGLCWTGWSWSSGLKRNLTGLTWAWSTLPAPLTLPTPAGSTRKPARSGWTTGPGTPTSSPRPG